MVVGKHYREVNMILRQTLSYPVCGYWDGGKKQVFDWSIEGKPQKDVKGQFIRIGSFQANFWFHVALGKTIKRTLANAKLYLRVHTKIPSTFEYVEE